MSEKIEKPKYDLFVILTRLKAVEQNLLKLQKRVLNLENQTGVDVF